MGFDTYMAELRSQRTSALDRTLGDRSADTLAKMAGLGGVGSSRCDECGSELEKRGCIQVCSCGQMYGRTKIAFGIGKERAQELQGFIKQYGSVKAGINAFNAQHSSKQASLRHLLLGGAFGGLAGAGIGALSAQEGQSRGRAALVGAVPGAVVGAGLGALGSEPGASPDMQQIQQLAQENQMLSQRVNELLSILQGRGLAG